MKKNIPAIFTILKPQKTTSYNVINHILYAVLFYVLGIYVAYAGTLPAGSGKMCTGIWHILSGNLLRGLSTLGIITIGVAASIAKITWGQATLVGIGIAVINGAALIAKHFGAACPT